MTRGIIYAHAGLACLARLIVSLHSLRKHWTGPATVFQEGPAEPELKAVCKELDVTLTEYDPTDCNKYTKKCHINTLATYDVNMYLDADTIVHGALDQYMDWIEEHGLVFTNFSNWNPLGGIMKGRINRWSELYPEATESAFKYPVALNTGTYGFTKSHPFLEGWLKTSIEGGNNGVPLTDELAAQLLVQFFPHYVAPIEWGYSVSFGEDLCPIDKARVIHYHGRKHVGENTCQKIWWKEFKEADDEWGMHCWGDRKLRRKIGKKKKPFKLPLEETQAEEPVVNEDSPVTYVTAVDSRYLKKLRKNYDSWLTKEKVFENPVIVYYDESVKSEELDFLPKAVRRLPWNPPKDWSQRERMLTVFVLQAPKDVQTPYWVKLDADVTITRGDTRTTWSDEWLQWDVVAHKWGYTRPKGGTWDKHWLNMLDAWWHGLTGEEPMFEPIADPMSRYRHKRFASFFCLQNTENTRELADMCGDRLPIPSHDTVLWYVASRKNWNVKNTNIKRQGLAP